MMNIRTFIGALTLVSAIFTCHAQRQPWQMGDELKDMVFVYHNLDNGKYSLVDIDGNKLSDDYPYMEKVRNESKVAIFKNNKGKYGVIGADGKVLLPAQYDDARIYKGRDTDRDAFITLTQKGKTALYDQNGEMLVDFKYNTIDGSYNDGLLYTTLGDRIGAINARTLVEVVAPGKYDNINILTPKFVSAEKGGVYELYCMNDGNKAVPYDISECIVPDAGVSPWEEGAFSTMLIRCADGYYMVTPTLYTFISNVGNPEIVGEGIAALEHDGKRYYVDINGDVYEQSNGKLTVISTPQGTRVFEKGTAKGDGVKMTDKDGRVLLKSSAGYDNPEWIPALGLFRMSKGAKVAFIDPHGNIVIPALYTVAGNDRAGYPEYLPDRLVVKKNGKVGVIDKRNKVIVPFNYTAVYPDTDISGNIDHYLAVTAGKNCVLNAAGKTIISPRTAPIIDYDFKYLDKAVAAGRYMVPNSASGTFEVFDSNGKSLGKRSMSRWWKIDNSATTGRVDYYSDWTPEQRANEFYYTYHNYYKSLGH